MTFSRLWWMPALLALAACTPKYGCKGYPDKAACLSAREAYEATEPKGPDRPSSSSELSLEKTSGPELALPKARRSEARILRVWQAPFENSEGDLEGAHYTLSEMEPRRWEVEGTPLKSRPKISQNPIRPELLALRNRPKLSASDEDYEDEP